MWRLSVVLITALVAFGAEDPWAKVRALKNGAELRIIKKGTPKPILAAFDELTDEKLIVATKSEQIAISREEIQRVDARPHTGKRFETESKTETVDNAGTAGKTPLARAGQSTSTSSGIRFGGKPDFETVYRRTAAAPRKE